MNINQTPDSEPKIFKRQRKTRNIAGKRAKTKTLLVTGGVGSPCHYGGVKQDQALLSPPHPHSNCAPGATPTHNQHTANNTQHFSNHQHSPMLYHNSGVQSNQYCYDSRTSVNLYPSGPGEAQDIRPSSNPASHQIGGKSCDLFMSCDHHYAISSSHLFCPKHKNYHFVKYNKISLLPHHKNTLLILWLVNRTIKDLRHGIGTQSTSLLPPYVIYSRHQTFK